MEHAVGRGTQQQSESVTSVASDDDEVDVFFLRDMVNGARWMTLQ